MFVNKASGIKKRRAPLPEEVYPNLVKDLVNETCDDGGTASAERLPMTLPLTEPVIRRQDLAALEKNSPSSRYSWAPDSAVVKLLRKRRSLDDIDFSSNNEALDVQRQSENVKALENIEYHNGHHKRRSSGDVSKTLHESSSKTSLRSFASSEESFLLNSLTSSCGTDTVYSQMVDQEDIVTLTAHVRHFSDALSKLRIVLPGNGSDRDSDENTDGGNPGEEMNVKAHESLGIVLSNLKEVINRYPSLKSREILAAAGNLITIVRNFNNVDNENHDEFYHAIDQLALVFGSSVSDLLMGDQEVSPNKAGDDGDEYPDDEDYGSEGDFLSDSMNMPSRQDPSCNEILRDKDADLDRVLQKMESGVDFCLQWTKCWSKYVKDIANYIEKRAQLEAEYTKQLTKLAQGTRASISEENYLPFQSTFITALDQDMEYAQKCQQTLTAISGSKFMEPLMQRRSVHDRARKDMKDDWTKTCRQLQETASSVKTSQHNYHKRKQDLEKLNTRQGDVKENKEESFSVFSSNKNKKEEELRSKVDEADQFYCNAIKVANDMQSEAEKTKIRIVAQTKQLVNECDRTFRSVTRKYFEMMHELAVPTPIHFKTLADGCQGYEPGKEFEDFIRFQQSTARCAVHQVYEFQPYGNGRPNNELESPMKGSLSPAKAWAAGHMSDYEGGMSPSGSPSSSPKNSKKHSRNQPSTDDESEGEIKKPKSSKPFRTGRRPKKFSKGPLTKEASTHTFHKIRAPARCSECDSYVFSGVECAQCGLSCHSKKCLENLQTPCSHSRRLPGPMKRMRTFGVRFSEDSGVPVLVTKCVKEINRRGLRVKGIYRVSGVKSKMESLCQEFETNAESVDLSTQPPHLIASVLKLYIRQLPEPLMTTKLYSDLIQLAKDSANLNGLTVAEYEDDQKQEFRKFLEKLQFTIKKLPRSNYLTTATLIKHLHKVSINEQYNQMSPQNLAIVFGPTILRLESENSTTSLSSLVDMSHQTRIVALLIVNPQVFDDVPDEPEATQGNGSNEENDSSLPNTPVEKFVTPKFEEESGMPVLYGERSTRVRGEGRSPMDQLASQSSDVTDIKRSNSDSMRINERVDIKGEATSVFDEVPNHLPGSLEDRNKYLELNPDEEKLPVVKQFADRRSRNAEQNQRNEKIYNSKLEGSEIIYNNDSLKLSEDSSLTGEIQDEFSQKLLSKVSVDSAKEAAEDFPSPGESSDDSCIPRRRSKAFSVGKRSSDPDMLAKRGSALMNAYMGDSNIVPEGPESISGSHSAEEANNSGAMSANDLEQENDVGANSESLPTTSTETNVSANETTDSDVTPVNTESEDPGHRTRAGTASAAALRSGNESGIRALYRDSPRRKRSATCESDRRKMFANRQERLEKQLTSDRLLLHGVRSRGTRVSVKDQIKQLENREQNDSSKSGRNNKPSAVVASPNNIASKTTGDTQSTSDHANENTNTLYSVDGKENINGNTEPALESPQVKSHEPLTRLYVAGENSGIFQPPRSPVPKYKTMEEKFCALKMDISLESHPPPSSSDDDTDTEVAMETHLLPKWQGRGLTPRDSRQAPEFV